MEFASIVTIWVFIPIALIAYYLASIISKNNIKILNIVLLCLSLIFYLMGGGISNLIRIIILIVITFLLALWINCFNGTEEVFKKSRKGVLIGSIVVVSGILCYYKYLGMVKSIYSILLDGTSLSNVIVRLLQLDSNIVIPLAISFIVFQCISYLVDVYKERIPVEKDFINFCLYNLLFFKLTQGPIMKHHDISLQLNFREHSLEIFSAGIRRFCFGLGKKVIIADTIAGAVNKIWALNVKEVGTFTAWAGLVLFTLQIYYDFSGYSDMAVGLGKMFGFRITENFNYPYTSLSIQEFWRRWHISLSTWFKDYIYIPLGGNREGIKRTMLNLIVVFFVTGLWHGSNLNFIVWGLYFAFFSIIERLFLGEVLKKNPIKLLNWFYSLFVVMIGWVFFRSRNLFEALRYVKYLFIIKAPEMDFSPIFFLNTNVLIALILGILLIGWPQRFCIYIINQKIKTNSAFQCVSVLVQLSILIVSILLLINGSYSPSLYVYF